MPAKNELKKNGTTKRTPIEGPFDPKLLAQARRVAEDYHIVLETGKDGRFRGSILEMPGVFGKGSTADACVESARSALTVGVASMLEAGAEPPQPFSERKRVEQMNIRLDAREKLILKQAAARNGFRSVSDYVRVVALKDART